MSDHCSECGTPSVTRAYCPWHDAAQGADELREAIAETLRIKTPLTGWQRDLRDYALSRRQAADLADALLSGPLAQLLATVGRMEALADELDQEMVDRGFVLDRIVLPGDRIRRALNGEPLP